MHQDSFMNSPSTSPTSPEVAVITLDDSMKDVDQNDSVINLSSAETTIVHFDGTLPPGATPDGFMLVDEDVDSSEIHTKEDSSNQTQPLFKILFKDVSTFSEYHQKIEIFLKGLVRSNSKKKLKSSTTDLVLEIFEFDDNAEKLFSNKFANQIEKQSNEVLFTVDTNPKLKDDLDIPMYGKKFSKTLQALQKSESADNVNNQNSGPKMTCFNCLGNHSLRDCQEPRNYAVINKNRKEHVAKRGSPSVRYHLDDDQKFGHFVPGQISLNLRRALGIKENELPLHIYKMRALGYPPGWLEEARLQHSGLALFNSDGNAEVGSDEEGEIISPGDKDKYDIKKIIDFPGFNVIPPQGTREKCEQYWGSFTQEQNSKSTMLSYLSNKKADDGYKRKKLLNSVFKKDISTLNPGEMDIDDVEDTAVECVPVSNLFIPPLPKEDTEVPPPPPPVPLTEDSDSQSQEDMSSTNDGSPVLPLRDGSPSLYDLECTKKQLLAELDNSSLQSNLPFTNTSASNQQIENVEASTSDSSKIKVPELESSKTEEYDSNKNNVNINNVTPKNSPKMQSNSGFSCKSVLSKHLGTPILHSVSPFKRLPSSEKFSKDICDVINFENLPDATGKYDQMAELLQKVRSRVSELQKEN